MEEDVPDWFRRDNRGRPLQERGDSRTETAHQDRWQGQIEELGCKLQPYVEHEGLGGVMRSPKILLARTCSARPLTLLAWPTLALLLVALLSWPLTASAQSPAGAGAQRSEEHTSELQSHV